MVFSSAINKDVGAYRGVFVLWTRELMNQFVKNHQLNKAEIGVTDESISDWISGSQDTFSSTFSALLSNPEKKCFMEFSICFVVFFLKASLRKNKIFFYRGESIF